MRPTVHDQLPNDAFAVVNRTVNGILAHRRGLWLTFGLAFTLWQLSGAVRATTGPLNRVYGFDEDRPWWRRIGSSLLLAAVIAPCLLLAVVAITLGNDLVALAGAPGWFVSISWVLGWAAGLALLLLTIWLLLRYGPARSPDWGWASLGSGVVVGGWVVATLIYAWYVSSVASYGSLFGGLASIIVALTYIYILALVFLGGVQLDALLRERLRDDAPPAAG